MITVDELKKIIQDNINRESEEIMVHEAVRGLLSRHEGKKISKRIATDLEKTHPDWKIYYDTAFGMYHLNVYIPNRTESVRIFVAYDSNPIISVKSFEEHDARNGYAALARNILRQSLLYDTSKLEEITNIINEYNEFVPIVEKLVCDNTNPDNYYFRRLLVVNNMNTGK